MAKKKHEFVPSPGKCDIIHGILIGGEQIKNLEKRNSDGLTAEKTISKLEAVQRNSSDEELKTKALNAITLLKKFAPKSTVPDTERQRIYKQVCGN